MTSIKVMGIELKFFAIFAVLVLTLTFFGKLPLGMAGAVPLLMVVGAILGYIGDRMRLSKIILVVARSSFFSVRLRWFCFRFYPNRR